MKEEQVIPGMRGKAERNGPDVEDWQIWWENGYILSGWFYFVSEISGELVRWEIRRGID